MALAVPLSRFTPRVGGGSAFYVRPLDHAMRFRLTYLIAVTFLVGCASSTKTGPLQSYSWSESLMSREIHLSAKQPTDADSKIRLVSIADDSTTTIRLSSGETLRGKPGDDFSPAIHLTSASSKADEAVFRLTWSETR